MYYKRLRDLREDHDLKQREIAELLKTTQQVYSEYEKGIREIPLSRMITLAKFYGVSLDYMVGLSDIPDIKTEKTDDKRLLIYSEKAAIVFFITKRSGFPLRNYFEFFFLSQCSLYLSRLLCRVSVNLRDSKNLGFSRFFILKDLIWSFSSSRKITS